MFGGGQSNRRNRNGRASNFEDNSEDILVKYELDFNESVNGSTKV